MDCSAIARQGRRTAGSFRVRRQNAEGPVRIPFSERDRYGAFAHRKPRGQSKRQAIIEMLATRAAPRRVSRPFLILLALVCCIGFAAPFAVTFILNLVRG